MTAIAQRILSKTTSILNKPTRRNPLVLNWFKATALATSSEVEKSKTAKRTELTIFEKIIKREVKADVIYEDEKCMAFNDVSPQAPVHFLVIPKRKIPMLDDATVNDTELLGHLLYTARTLAKSRLPKGYRVVINNGVEGCQSVYHLHVHVIGGRQMKWPPG